MTPETPSETEAHAIAVRLVHATPGRVRVRVPREALANGALGEAEAALAAVPGIREIRTNRLAGSVVITYDEDVLDVPSLLAAVSGTGVTLVPSTDGEVGPAEAAPGESQLGRSLSDLFGRADRSLHGATRGGADLRALIPLGLAALAAREMLAGRFGAAPGYVLLWYAFDSFWKLRRPPPPASQPEP